MSEATRQSGSGNALRAQAVSRRRALISLAFMGVSTSCNGDRGDDVGRTSAALIYGADDRRDLSDLDEPDLRMLALQSTAAQIARDHLVPVDTHYVVHASALAASARLCPGAAFETQPTAASCSAVLVDDDLLITAGHCAKACGEERWVFGYAWSSAGQATRIEAADVYRCRSLPLRVHVGNAAAPPRDYALVQLERPVTSDKHPASVVTDPASAGQPVIVIGYPEGLPVKVDQGARIVAVSDDEGHFELTSDTYVGSSGSGIFDRERRLLGILVRGSADYVFDTTRHCYVPQRLDETTDSGEEAVHMAPIIEALCARGWPSARLCDSSRACDAGDCSSDRARGIPDEPDTRPRRPQGGCAAAPGALCPSGCRWMLVSLPILMRRRTRLRW